MVIDLRPQLGRKAPYTLILVGLIALFFASFYMYQVFLLMPEAIESDDIVNMTVALGMMLIMFLLYSNYVLTIFRLSSGSRKAWVGMIRLSFTYIAMALISFYGLSSILPVHPAFEGTVLMWVMIGIMILMMAYMLTKRVTNFFTPGYADEVPRKAWAMYIIGSDPFKGKNLIVLDEDPSA